MTMIENLWVNLDYVASVALFLIGLYALIAKSNLIKKLMGLNIMETAIFAFVVAIGNVSGGDAPVLGKGAHPPFTNPLPHALILTGIVVALSTTAVALALIIRIHERYGTLETDDLWEAD